MKFKLKLRKGEAKEWNVHSAVGIAVAATAANGGNGKWRVQIEWMNQRNNVAARVHRRT